MADVIPARGRQLVVELPALSVSATVRLLDEAAPEVCNLIWDALDSPLVTSTAHACFDGEEIYCFLPPFSQTPPRQNQTMRPRPGEVMFFYAGENEFACTRSDRLSGGSTRVFELAFMYGETDLRHYYDEGFRGSLVGYIDTGLEDFAAACRSTLINGRTKLRVARATGAA